MSEEKIYCGNGKAIETKYGEMLKLSFSKADGMTYEMSCRGLLDIGRDKGDQVGYAHIDDIPE